MLSKPSTDKDDDAEVLETTRQRRKRSCRYTNTIERDTLYLGRGKVAETREDGPFFCDAAEKGLIIGIGILAASKVPAPGDWRNARLPGTAAADPAE